MSECRKPVKAEKSAARFRTSSSHGVSTKVLSSSSVKYSLLDSSCGIDFTLAAIPLLENEVVFSR